MIVSFYVMNGKKNIVCFGPEAYMAVRMLLINWAKNLM